jgi:hypothetical protein
MPIKVAVGFNRLKPTATFNASFREVQRGRGFNRKCPNPQTLLMHSVKEIRRAQRGIAVTRLPGG